MIQRAHRAPRLRWSIRFAQQGEAAYRVHPCGGEVGAQAAHLSAPWENPELVMLSCRPPDEAQLLLEPQPQLPCPADVQEGLAPPPPIWPLMKSALRSGIDPGLRPSSPPDHIVFPDRLSPPPPRGERGFCEREPCVGCACAAKWPTRAMRCTQSWRLIAGGARVGRWGRGWADGAPVVPPPHIGFKNSTYQLKVRYIRVEGEEWRARTH